MKHGKLFLLFLLIQLTTFSQGLVVPSIRYARIDTLLMNNADRWHIKNELLSPWEIPKIKFGSFNTIETYQSKQVRISSNKEDFFTFSMSIKKLN